MNKRLSFLLYIIMGMLASGCKTTVYTPTQRVYEKTVGDIRITLHHVTEDEIQKLHGKKANPYDAYPGKLPRKQFLVFDATITSEQTQVHFKLRDMALVLDTGVSDNAQTKESLKFLWKPYIDDDSTEAAMNRTIKATLTGNSFTVSPDEPYKGYIVFLIKSKNAERGRVEISAETADGEKGMIDIPIDLASDNPKSGIKKDSPDKKGFFSD